MGNLISNMTEEERNKAFDKSQEFNDKPIKRTCSKLDINNFVKNNKFEDSDIQTMLVHLSQSQVWLEMLLSFKPTGKFKERVTKAKQALFMLNQMFPVDNQTFDLAVEISDSLLQITSLNADQQELLLTTIKNEIEKLTTNE